MRTWGFYLKIQPLTWGAALQAAPWGAGRADPGMRLPRAGAGRAHRVTRSLGPAGTAARRTRPWEPAAL